MKIHSVALTPTFQRQADRLKLMEVEVMAIVSEIAADPLAGDLIVGTGGARKVRHRRAGGGKSGGYRTIHYSVVMMFRSSFSRFSARV